MDRMYISSVRTRDPLEKSRFRRKQLFQLHPDLDRLVDWSYKLQMKSNLNKFYALYVRSSNDFPNY